MDINTVNPFVRVAMHSVLETGISRRAILDYELIFVESGTLHLMYNNKEYFFGAGALLLLCPGVPHTFLIERDCPVSQPHIHFDMEYDRNSKDMYTCYKDLPAYSNTDKRLLRRNIFPEQASPEITVENKKAFLETFYKLIDSFGENALNTKALCLMLIQTVIEDNFKANFSLNKEKPLTAKELKGYIDANCDKYLTLDILENQFHYSRFYLEKEFKAMHNCSIMKYYNEKRLLKAKELLREMTVTQTANALGYSSIYAFSRAYKNKFGVSPSIN